MNDYMKKIAFAIGTSTVLAAPSISAEQVFLYNSAKSHIVIDTISRNFYPTLSGDYMPYHVTLESEIRNQEDSYAMPPKVIKQVKIKFKSPKKLDQYFGD